jgi:phosphatidylinositol kinase/protein kinase (PI-3  family)
MNTRVLCVLAGETMHVDFGCLFDRGLTLEVPEVVPFRMTQNVVDMCGVSGVEGVLRCTAEIVLQVRRPIDTGNQKEGSMPLRLPKTA